VENTRRVLEACSIRFETGLQLNRRTFMGTKQGDFNLLTKLAESGCQRRYGPPPPRAQERVRKELKVIAELDFATYFLITWDIVRYAESLVITILGGAAGPIPLLLTACTSPMWNHSNSTFISSALSTRNAARRPISTLISPGTSETT
jgi:hypothetical protein